MFVDIILNWMRVLQIFIAINFHGNMMDKMIRIQLILATGFCNKYLFELI